MRLAPDRGHQLRMAEITLSSRAKTIVLLILGAMIAIVLWKAGGVVIPFVWALVTAYLFNPLITFASERTRTTRLVWVFFLYIVLGLIGAWALLELVPIVTFQVRQLARELPQIMSSAEQYFGAQNTIDILGFRIETQALNFQITSWTSDFLNAFGRGAFGFVVGLAETLLSVIVYLFVTFYLLLDGPRFVRFLKEQAPAKYHAEIDSLLIRINRVLSAFIRGQLILVIIMTTATYIVLSILHVRYALVLAIATGILELIPFVGPYIAGALSVSMAFFQPFAPFGWSHLLLAGMVALAYFILRELEDNLVIPNVIGSLVDLHPIVVIFVVLAGAALAGVTGLFLAVPATAVVRVIAGFIYPKLVKRAPREMVQAAPADTVEGVMEKVLNTKTSRVVLVIPSGMAALSGKKNLRTMRDVAKRAKVDLAISCPSSEVCYQAEKLGIKTMYDLQDLEISPG